MTYTARTITGRLAVVAVVVMTSAACSSAHGGSTAATSSSPAAVDASQLDPGKYPTKPAPFGPAGDDVAGRSVDAQSLANFVTGPWEVDPALIGWFPTSGVAVNKAEALPLVGSKAFVDIGVRHGFIDAFHASRAETGRKQLSSTILRFPDAASAAAAATEMLAAVTVPAPDATFSDVVQIPGHSDTPAVGGTVTDAKKTTYQAVRSFTPHGPYVLALFAETVDGGLAAPAALLGSYLDLQVPLLDQFQATPPSGLAALPMDPTGLLARTLPVDPKDLDPTKAVHQRVVYQPRGALHFEIDPVSTSKVYTDGGVDLVAMAKTNVYQARDAAAATRVVDGLAAILASATTPVDAVKGLPNSRCMQGAASKNFICLASTDRYAFEASGTELLDVQQQVAAQYLLLTAH